MLQTVAAVTAEDLTILVYGLSFYFSAAAETADLVDSEMTLPACGSSFCFAAAVAASAAAEMTAAAKILLVTQRSCRTKSLVRSSFSLSYLPDRAALLSSSRAS